MTNDRAIANPWTLVAGSGMAISAVLAGFMLPVGAYLGAVALLFLVAAGVLAVTAQLRRPTLGLSVLVVMAVALPIEFPGPSSVIMSMPLLLATAICGVWLARSCAVRRSISPGPYRLVYAVFAFLGTALVAFVAGQFPWFPTGNAPLPAQVVELALFLVSGCLLLAVGQQLTDVSQLKWLTWVFVGAGTITATLQTVPSLGFIARLTTRPGSVGSLFWTWIVAVTVSQAFFNRSLGLAARLGLLGITALVMGHSLLQVSSWASGWAPPLVAIGAIVLLRFPRLTLASAMVAIPLGLFAIDYLPSGLLADEQYSLLTRQEAWRVLWNLVERSPIVGTGMANYYYYTENFPILGWYVRFISHNNYQDLLVQTGFLGLLVFSWLAVEAIVLAYRLSTTLTPGFSRAYAVGVFGGVAGSLASGMLGDWIVPFYYNAGVLGFRSSLLFWLFLGGLVSLRRLTRHGAHGDIRSRVVQPDVVQRGGPGLSVGSRTWGMSV